MMTLYETKTAPNPRRVRMFLTEKGVGVNYAQIDIEKGENLTPEMLAKNPLGKVPILELEDGTCISECDAICTYLEAQFPEPCLMGKTPLGKGIVAMWQRRMEVGLMLPIGQCFQHTTGYLRDRMTPVPEFGQEAGKDYKKSLTILDQCLAESEFIAGDAFSIADITALCAIDFARVVKMRLDDNHPNVQRWHASVSQRPSAKA